MRKFKEGIYERKDSQFFWASFTDASGKRIRCSTGIVRSRGSEGRREANALLSKWKTEVYEEVKWGRKPDGNEECDISFDAVLLEYFKARPVTSKVKSTARHLYLAFQGRSITSIEDLEVKAYIRQRQTHGASPATINKEVGLFCAAINYCRDELGWKIPNPAAKKKLREPQGITRWITPDEAQQLIAAARDNRRAPWLVDFVRLALNTGCRLGEMLWLTWDRVDFQNNLIWLGEQDQKGRKVSTVPINQEARGALLSRANFRAGYCPESPWVFCRKDGERLTTLRRSFKSAIKKAGIKKFRIHDQRHTLASWLVMDGVPLYTVRDVLRHSSIKMTERYAHLSPENTRAALSLLDQSRNSHVDGRERPSKLG
ncbi:site-specific integrase [Methylocaldum sp. 14B]|jgi:integrase|uniref:tyrosine-type recombinase/integrase n=1 Tax=Methylocaldum sp. 14B TaxID=1912213 RepID=UPI00098A25E5|nr:site-specific integrase [Methylocaldum sp. 14B]